MQKHPFTVRGGGSKKFDDWGWELKILGLGALLIWEGVTFAWRGGGVSLPHYLPWLFHISHNCVTECTMQAKFLLKLI